jgi:hypothetical protein
MEEKLRKLIGLCINTTLEEKRMKIFYQQQQVKLGKKNRVQSNFGHGILLVPQIMNIHLHKNEFNNKCKVKQLMFESQKL